MVKDQNRQQSPLAPLHHLEFILQHKADQLLRPAVGFGFGQLRILEGLDSARAISQRALAAKLYQTEANISRQLKILQIKGLVEITKDKQDKRQRRVRLTGAGTKAAADASEILHKLHSSLLSKVDYRDAFNFTETATKLLNSI